MSTPNYDTIHATLENGNDTVFLVPNGSFTNEETFYDRNYRFEGYKVYQLASDEVGADELDNTDKARLVFQCDVRNNVGKLLNYEFDESLQANVPKMKVEGGDGGITHSFVVTDDKFATGDNPNLVNHKSYYYMAVAYAYNCYAPYSQDDANGLLGQKKPYLEGRKNIQCYTAVPHKTVNGTVLQAKYGDQPAVNRVVGVGNGGNELELTKESVDEIMSKPIAWYDDAVDYPLNKLGSPDYPICYHPKYEAGFGPVDVKIIDPLNVKSHRYELWFDEMFVQYTHNVTNNNEVFGDSAARVVCRWNLLDLDEPTDTLDINPKKSDTTTIYQNEQMFIDRGISITVAQPYDLGRIWIGKYFDDTNNDGPDPEDWHDYEDVVAFNNGVITSSIEFTDPDNPWMDGIRDSDEPASSFLNWIRSGTYASLDDPSTNDYSCSAATSSVLSNKPWDPNENFEKLANRTWAPALLCTFSGQGTTTTNPGPNASANAQGFMQEHFKKTASVDIVFTADKSKWTRCPVIEMCMDNRLSEGGAKRFFLRKHASVDKEGNPTTIDWETTPDSCSMNPDDANYIAAQGMGWFPGYAIDVESGIRLNIAFGEDSYLEDMGGRDMLFNPAKLQKVTVDDASGAYQMIDPAIFRGSDNDPVFGGKHFVYIWRMDSIPMASSSPWQDVKNYAYDGGRLLFNTMNFAQHHTNLQGINHNLYSMLMWIGMPMGIEGTEWLPEGNECRVRIRLAKPYAPGYGYELQTPNEDLMINNLNPKYNFTIEGWDPILNDPKKTESDLDLVTVVPNPYYAYDTYEGNALTNRVKIANLPQKCVVTIYTLSGTKVRQFRKDNDSPNIDWDLTNFANTPVASGFYLIHVKDLTSGSERVIKFFGAMRQVDLNTF